MTHFVVLIVIPHYIYVQGAEAIQKYIDDVLEKYDENKEMPRYIEKSKDDLLDEFEEFKKSENGKKHQFNDVNDYAEKWHGYSLDENGNVVSTYNKDALYDWYEIGGRWDGCLTNNCQYSDGGYNYDKKHHTLDNNMISVKQLLENYNKDKSDNLHNVVIDKSGFLQRDRQFGWFGTYTEKCDENKWKQTYEKILEESKDDYVVNLDCHI